MVAGECWEQSMSGLHIGDCECGSLLPTPTGDYGTRNNGARGDGSTYRTAGSPSLSMMARHNLWPTPRNNTGESHDKKHMSLDGAVKLWPTPTAGDAKSSGSRNTFESKAHMGVSLTDAVRGDGGVGRQVPGQFVVKLNPSWVEWLMGWPVDWTSLDEPMRREVFDVWLASDDLWAVEPVPRVTSNRKNRDRLRAIGNGQVPSCARLAWETLRR
jgi:DNA (cytosine-5)-methyltransferase 1